MSSKTLASVIIGGAVLGVAVVGASWYMQSRADGKDGKRKKSRKKKKSKKKKPKVDAETVVKILKEINSLLSRTCMALVNYEGQLRQKAGGQVTEKEIRDHISQTFMQELKKFEVQVYKKFNTTQEDVRQSIGALPNHEGIAKEVKKTKAIFSDVRKGNLQNAGGSAGNPNPSVALPKGFGRDKALSMLKKVMAHICVCIEEVANEINPEGGPIGKSPVVLQRFNQLFQAKTEAKAAELCVEAGITKDVS